MKSSFFTLLLILLLLSVSNAETSYKFFQLEKEPIDYTVNVNSDSVATLTINNKISLITQPGAYSGQGGSRNLYAKLSDDKNKIIVFVGDFSIKDAWVVDLEKNTVLFETHENLGKLFTARWITNSKFEIEYGGMGYRVFKKCDLSNNSCITEEKALGITD